MGEICIFENELQNVAHNVYHICENSHKLMVLEPMVLPTLFCR